MGVRMKEFAIPAKIICDEKTYSSNYGKFIAEPFERGYGVTVGSSLRRVLLSSIEGSAVTAVKMAGVQHEFSTIPGILEDMPQIISNIKGLVLKSHTSSAKVITLKGEKKKEYKAKDIVTDDSVEIINPDHHILTMTENTKLNIDMEVGKGRGWISSEKNKKTDMPIGFIAVDSLFSPVTRMNFEVENTRVGAITDYEKLIIEIWTNGGVEPKEALVYASYIMQRHLDVFGVLGEVVEEEDEIVEDGFDEGLMDKMKMSISELELSVRSANCLEEANIRTIGELVTKTEPELLLHRNFGKKSLNELNDILKKMGLSFGMKLHEDIKKKIDEESVKK